MYEAKDVSRETYFNLQRYEELIIKWNSTINLVSKKDVSNIWNRHIMDSAQLMNYIKQLDVSVIDVGSGAGLPGVVLSILGIKETMLVESDQRKAVFLLQAIRLSDNRIKILNERVENIKVECDILICRAFANLNRLFKQSSNIKVRNKYLLLKGKTCFEEINEAMRYWNFEYILYDSETSPDGKVLEIYNLKSRNEY